MKPGSGEIFIDLPDRDILHRILPEFPDSHVYQSELTFAALGIALPEERPSSPEGLPDEKSYLASCMSEGIVPYHEVKLSYDSAMGQFAPDGPTFSPRDLSGQARTQIEWALVSGHRPHRLTFLTSDPDSSSREQFDRLKNVLLPELTRNGHHQFNHGTMLLTTRLQDGKVEPNTTLELSRFGDRGRLKLKLGPEMGKEDLVWQGTMGALSGQILAQRLGFGRFAK